MLILFFFILFIFFAVQTESDVDQRGDRGNRSKENARSSAKRKSKLVETRPLARVVLVAGFEAFNLQLYRNVVSAEILQFFIRTKYLYIYILNHDKIYLSVCRHAIATQNVSAPPCHMAGEGGGHTQ